MAVLTAKAAALKPEHLAAAGITRTDNLHVHGLEGCPQWSKIFTSPDEDMDLEAVRGEILGVALDAVRTHPRTAAFVLECTDLPPFAAAIRNMTGLPVFDFITMVNTVHASL